MCRNSLVFLFSFLLSCKQGAVDQPAKNVEKKNLTVCSQNLARLGEKEDFDDQMRHLVNRMSKAGCSIIALQEISLKKPWALEQLAKELSSKTRRKFEYFVGKSRDSYIANGFLAAQDLGKIKGVKSYWNMSLPRLNPFGPARNFTRGPVLLRVELAPEFQLGEKKNLELISIHLKSKSNGWKDPAKMNFEVNRIESAEAIRNIALEEDSKDTLVVVMGDRNNGKDRASDEVLEGRVLLKDISEKGNCKLTKNEMALCKNTRIPSLIGLFGLRLERFPGKFPEGSHMYRGKESLLDEAFIPPDDLEFVTRSDNTFSIGYQGEYFKGSDHKLLFLELSKKNVD